MAEKKPNPSDETPVGVDLDAVPLISMPSIMLTLLRAAAAGDATPDSVAASMAAHLEQIGEPPQPLLGEIERRMGIAVEELAAAGLIEEPSPGRYAITGRGRIVLRRHPLGVDESVLEQFRDFRKFVKAISNRFAAKDALEEEPSSAEAAAYLVGHAAGLAGGGVEDNPHRPDRAEHLAWELGWSEARDEAIEHGEPAEGKTRGDAA
jgi:hypothetical protein